MKLTTKLWLGLSLGLPAITWPAFGADTPSGPPAGTAVDRLEAAVNSSIIFLSDVTQFRKTLPLRTQLDPLFQGTELAAKGERANDNEIIDFLVNERIITQEFPIKDSEVEQEITSIQANNRIDRKGLETALKQQGFKFSAYFEMIRTSISKRALIDRDIRTKVFISDDDVKNYFYNISKEPPAGLSYRIGTITAEPAKRGSVEAAREAIQKALDSVKKGDAFTEVAKKSSDAPSAVSGGDLGFFDDATMDEAIRSAIKKLKVGQTSEVLGSPEQGFYIVKLIDLKSGQEAELERQKESIRQKLSEQEYQHQLVLWLERERQKAFVHLASI